MKNNMRRAVYVLASVIIIYGLTLNSSSSGAAAADAVRPIPAATSPEPATLPPDEEVRVMETGDPSAPAEDLVVNPGMIDNALDERHTLAAFPGEQMKYKDARRWANGMVDYALELAEREPPVTRRSNPRQIKDFVGLFNYRSENVPFCAMGVAYAAVKSYCALSPEKIPHSRRNDARTFQNLLPVIKKFYFTPSASCFFMMKEAMKRKSTQRGGWVAKGVRQPKRGWLVLFDWKNRGDGVPDHVGIVRSVGGRNSDRLYTVEFNTSVMSGNQRNGGAVAKKVRDMDDVLGYIRTY